MLGDIEMVWTSWWERAMQVLDSSSGISLWFFSAAFASHCFRIYVTCFIPILYFEPAECKSSWTM